MANSLLAFFSTDKGRGLLSKEGSKSDGASITNFSMTFDFNKGEYLLKFLHITYRVSSVDSRTCFTPYVAKINDIKADDGYLISASRGETRGNNSDSILDLERMSKNLNEPDILIHSKEVMENKASLVKRIPDRIRRSYYGK